MSTQPDNDSWAPLIEAARRAMANAYAPYSRFAVGAALRTREGAVHAGANVENVAFPSGQCAEASAIGAMVSDSGVQPIEAIVVASLAADFTWPCGNCRQKLAEFATPDCVVLAVTPGAISAPVALAGLLPSAFAHFD